MTAKMPKFSEGERILYFHGPIMYEAKCNKVEFCENKNYYYYHVQYNRRNKQWDEWAQENKLLKYNEENVQRQKNLLKQHGNDKVKRGKHIKVTKTENRTESLQNLVQKIETEQSCLEPVKKKMKIESSVESEDMYLAKVEVNVQVPDALKAILVDDWDLVMRQKKFHRLPAKITVENILNSFIKEYTNLTEKGAGNNFQELISGIKEYFDIMLGSQLLYSHERFQHEKIQELHPGLTMSQIYGIPHLLRFFVSIGTMLSYTSLSEKNMSLLVERMQKVIYFVESQITSLFDINEYVIASTYFYNK